MTMTGALVRGLVAGAFGAGAQTLFFRLTSDIAPPTPKKASPALEKTSLAARIVHVGFGAAWGGIYGLLRRSTRLMGGALGPVGGVAFGALVWAVGDNVLLPAFRLAAWPNRHPLKNHAYALAAHVVYGAATWGAFELETRRALAPAVAAVAARWAMRKLPRAARPAVAPVVRKAFVARAKLPAAIDRALDAAESVAR
jgi:hypothetical protein